MNSNMKFFIVFFNQEAIPMPARALQPSVVENQKKYLFWMQSIRAIGDTDPTEAIKKAIGLKPDVIYFLTDGSFPHKIEMELLKFNQSRSKIHTFAFEQEIPERYAKAIEFLREDNYKDARRLLSIAELRKAREMYRAEEVLRKISSRNGGKFHMIP